MANRRAFTEQEEVKALIDSFSGKAYEAEIGFCLVLTDEHGTSVVSNCPSKIRLAGLLAQTAASECELAMQEGAN